jgi:hypothetical protein
MTDRDLIIQFLEKVRGRVRTNSRLGEIAKVVALAMLLPVAFKLLDFYFLFRGRTVTTFFTLWLAGTLVWVASRLRGSSSIADVAANVDHKANLNDQLKTAYWFIKNPRASEWVDVQIQRAAKATGKLSLNSLYPRIVPRTSFLAAGLLFLLVGLNFVPLSLNYNWVYLQAAPAFQLTEEERLSLENALRLLERARDAENEALAQKIEELISDLEQGNISLEEAIQQLEELQSELEESDVEAGEATNGIQQMAAILRKAKALQKAASPMGQGDLAEAANQLRDLGERLNSVTPPDLRDMAQRLLEASENPRASLQELARAFESTSSAIQKGDQTASKDGLEKIASELEKVKQRIDEQELVAAAGEELGDLVESLQEREELEGEATAGEPGKQAENQGKGEENSSGEPGEGEAEESNGEPGGEEGEGQEGGESGEAGENPGGESPENGEGKGGNSYGGSTKSAPLEGEATSLEVQLQQEALKIEALEGGAEPDKKNEAAGEQERSKIDYRNAPSDLTPAQRDLLNQDRIPWESRQLIKNYFQAVKPKQTK